MQQKIIIAIDGPSGGGKSSTAKGVAAQLGYSYIDTGAMYRAVTLYLYENSITFDQREQVLAQLPNIKVGFAYNSEKQRNETQLNGRVVEDEIRKQHISERVSAVSAIPEVRTFLVAEQRQLGRGGGVVMDGRDIGTNVFPGAELKIFMTADVAVRAKRRQQELEAQGEQVPLEAILNNLKDRDRQDSSRALNPLRRADDAVDLDTTELDFNEQVHRVVALAQDKVRELMPQ